MAKPGMVPQTIVAASQPVIGCDAVNAYNWDKSVAHAICEAESGGNPLATGHNTNGTTDRGLMQVNSIHADLVEGNLDSLYDAHVNMAVAYQLYQAHGFQPWSTYTSGKYRQFL